MARRSLIDIIRRRRDAAPAADAASGGVGASPGGDTWYTVDTDGLDDGEDAGLFALAINAAMRGGAEGALVSSGPGGQVTALGRDFGSLAEAESAVRATGPAAK
jgi:hypothetical protein